MGVLGGVGGVARTCRDPGTTLEKQFEIDFVYKKLPTAEEAAKANVDRQAKVIRDAARTIAFDGYLGTVRELKKRPDGDMLLAAALRGFFLWDRMRRIEQEESIDTVGALRDAREEKRERRGRRDGGDRDRGPRRRSGGGGRGGGRRR